MKQLWVLLPGLIICLGVKYYGEARLNSEMKNVETRLTKAIDFDFSSPKWADIGNDIFDVLK